MKTIFLMGTLLIFSLNAAEDMASYITEEITAEQVARIRETILTSTASYDQVAANFFRNHNYRLFIGPQSPLLPLAKEVHGILETNRKHKKKTGYRRLQLLYSFLTVAQEKDPLAAYGTELAEEGNRSLRKFNEIVLDSSKKSNHLWSAQWAANATVLVVAHDVAERRKRFKKPLYE